MPRIKKPNKETLATLGQPEPLKDTIAADKAIAKIKEMFPPEVNAFIGPLVFRSAGVEVVFIELHHDGSADVRLDVFLHIEKERLH